MGKDLSTRQDPEITALRPKVIVRTWRISTKFELETEKETSSQPLPFVNLRPHAEVQAPAVGLGGSSRKPVAVSLLSFAGVSRGPRGHFAVSAVRGFEAWPRAWAWVPCVHHGLGTLGD